MSIRILYIKCKSKVRDVIQVLKFYIQIRQSRILHKKALAGLKEKPQINCVFFVLFPDIWKYDRIYELMLQNDRFNPIILVCPIVNFGRDNMITKMDQCYSFFQKKGYTVIKSFDDKSDTYVNVRDLNPDIIFYTNPYKGLIDDRYYITQFKDILTVYVPYFMNCSAVKGFSSNLPLHNLVWRKYAETDYEFQLSKTEQMVHGRNVVNTGYPGIELLIDNNYTPNSQPWKLGISSLKRIIWAPHHTIEKGKFGHTCFLEYCDFMLEIVKKYEEKVQFVFKPHPILRSKLDLLWGKEKTDAYYNKWANMPNSTIHESDYIDLFLTSDAMIHDSGSFIVEYLYVNKPVMRTLSDYPLSEVFNKFGLDCLKQYYMSTSKEDIEQFIQNVINGVDPMKEQRTKFVNEVLMPKDGMPSQNIINDIIDSIERQRV